MKTIVMTFGVFLLIFSSVFAEANTDQAVKAAEEWLKLVDAGQYDKSWDEAAAFFKAQVKKDDWSRMVKPLRESFWAVKSRKLGRSNYTKSLPGAPDGEYVVIQFETSFEKKAKAVETITPMKDVDGQWRVSGYFIK